MTNKLTLHPTVESDLLKDWQAILDILAELMHVPAALIVHTEKNQLRIYATNQNKENPFSQGERLPPGTSILNEIVLETAQELNVTDIGKNAFWSKTHEVQYGLINYLGYPLHWPDGELFGTICVMNTDTSTYTEKQQKLMLQIKNIVESNLELLEKNQQLEVLSKNLQHLANTDDLTGTWNRRAFINESNKELQRTLRSNHDVCLLMMDIDDFKDINDAYGHEVGDEVLKLFSHCIQATKRPYDIFGRIGGEEFAILLPETTLKQASILAERLRQKVSEIFYFTNGRSINITVSIGVYQLENEETSILTALGKADKLLYAAKHAGKNIVMAHSL